MLKVTERDLRPGGFEKKLGKEDELQRKKERECGPSTYRKGREEREWGETSYKKREMMVARQPESKSDQLGRTEIDGRDSL